MRVERHLAFRAALLTTCLLTPVVGWTQDTAAPQATEVDEIIITGRRAADRAALESKRDSNSQVDQIRADDVGRLPDQNVAEALRRLPGLSVANDQGEGRYLTVRGVSPDLLNVTLNGQTAAAPEPESRQVKLDDIPSGLIGAVTVVKTLTPDLDANAIAGQANIETVTAFDRGRTFGTFRGAYGYNEINEENPYEFDGSFGTLFGADRQFGVVLALNHSSRILGSENVQAGTNWSEVNGFDVPLEYAVRQYNTQRERTGAVANFDWRPNSEVRTFLRLMYSQYQDAEARPAFGLELDEDELSNQSADGGDFAEADAYRALRSRSEDTSTMTASIGGEFDIGENWLNVELTATRADKNDPNRDEWIFEAGGISGSYDLSEPMFRFYPEAAASDASNYEFAETSYESREAIEDLIQGRIDYRMPIGIGYDSTIQFGLKFLDRDKTSDADAMIYEGYAGGAFTLDQVQGPSLGSIFDGRYELGVGIDRAAADAFFQSNMSDFELDEEGSIGDSLAADYQVTERITAAYLMTTLKMGAWTVIPGVRVENTDSDYAAKAVLDTYTIADVDNDYDTFGSQSYTDWFPGVNVRYDLGADLVLRAAVTTAIGRPNYEQLAPITIVNTADNEVEMGNPNLRPLYSTNFDAAIEYYIGETGILSMALFRKEIENPIYFATVTEDGTYAGQNLTGAQVTRPVNAAEATVTGVEFNAQYELAFLPSPFDGLSAGASLTIVDSEASGIPGRPGETLPLANQSDTVASAQLSYEKYGFAGRIAYTHRSAYLLEPGDSAYNDLYVDDFNQWDARISYAVTPRAAVFLEGSNLNDEPNQLYQGIRARVDEVERYGWSVRTGLQINF
jgi:TonB-dependent receptor